MTLDDLRQATAIGKAVLEGVVTRLKAEGRLTENNGRLARTDHRVTFADEDAAHLQAIEDLFRHQAFCPPAEDEIVQKTALAPKDVRRLLHILREHGQLVVVEDLLFHREAVARARQILVEFLRKEGRLESVKFKYLLDTTRKFAIPLLDHFDRVGVTRRSGHTRYLKEPPARNAGRS
jgi:selenocysteine-specific elongation factor